MPAGDDSRFAGSIPSLYERYLVPLIFEPYAVDLCRRVSALNRQRATQAAEAALSRQFGSGPVEGAIQAHVVTART